MATAPSADRGQWGSKLGFVLAAAGSAVGLGNMWRFPSEVAENGGAAFLFIYLACCFLVGFPVMVAELAMGRRAKRNPVGTFKALHKNKAFALIGGWGVLCGVMILSYYLVLAGWTLSFVFSEFFHGIGSAELAAWFADNNDGTRNGLFSAFFLLLTIFIVSGGISGGIERAAKIMMPVLLVILFLLIFYVFTLEGASEGLTMYLTPDFSKIDMDLILQAMGQAFFSLSLGMGALITYGSYLSKKQNLPEAAAYVTLADVGVAFVAGLLIIPAMFVAQNNGIAIFDESGALLNQVALVYDILPSLFHTMGTGIGTVVGVAFFVLLSMAALTSTISLLEVPVSYVVDEHGMPRRKAAWTVGLGIGVVALIIAFNLGLIGPIDNVFSNIGLPLGGLMICIFLGYVWKTETALAEMKDGFEDIENSLFGKLWPIFVKYICPLLIAIVFVTTLLSLL